ncbi:MAG: hypothetical protein V1799_03520 [bacterium]
MHIVRLSLLLLILLAGLGIAHTQQGMTATGDYLTWNYNDADDSGFSLGTIVGRFFTPQLIQDVQQIRRYIRHEKFAILMRRDGDLRAVDAIYQKALAIADYNIVRALFLSMMGVLDHQNLEIRIPVLGKVGVPLTYETDSLYSARINHLPAKLYPDSPETSQSDKDKLQHFFGSAYLAYTTDSPELARASGNFIEWGETQFIVGGVNDIRDRRANKQGEQFGHDLSVIKNLLPSEYIHVSTRIP